MLIFIIILLIIVVYLYNQTLIETKKENMKQIDRCTRNCGNYNIDRTSTNISRCLSCEYCGVCSLPNKKQICMNGDEDGAYFNSDCSGSNWNFGSSPTKSYTPSRVNYDYEKQLIELGHTDNLPSQITDVSYEIKKEQPKISAKMRKQTSDSLADLLNKINSTNNNNIDMDTKTQLQEILNRLQNSSN
jgi:hypothetical protein